MKGAREGTKTLADLGIKFFTYTLRQNSTWTYLEFTINDFLSYGNEISCFRKLIKFLACLVCRSGLAPLTHQSTLCTAHCALHTTHCTLCTAHCTLCTAHYTLHTVNCTLSTAHSTLHTVHCTLHTTNRQHYILQCSVL